VSALLHEVFRGAARGARVAAIGRAMPGRRTMPHYWAQVLALVSDAGS